MKLHMFRTVRLFIIGSLCSILILLESCLQTCMTYTIAECTVNKLLMIDRRTVRNTWSFMTKKFVKLVHLVGFITKKFFTMHGHMNVKMSLRLLDT